MNENEEKKLAIHIEDLKKNYGNKVVLKGISLDVYEGELFGFIGKNGVGKSTTIECMLGMKTFDSGTIEIEGHDITKKALEVKELIGYVSSEPICYEDMRGYDYMEFIASIYKISEQVFEKNLTYLINRLALSIEDLYRPIREYSHGMKQKICLIASLIHNPKLWVLDEPTVGLDAFTSNELCLMMKEYVAHGNTCFIASHNIDLVAKLCDRVAIINEGEIANLIDLRKNPGFRAKLNAYFLEVCKKKETYDPKSSF